MLRIWVFLLLALSLSACLPSRRTIQRTEPLADIVPPTFEVVAGQSFIERFDPPGAGATVELVITTQVTNPNAFGITLKRVSFEVSLANQRVIKGELEPQTFIGAGREVPLKFRLSTSIEGKLDLIKAVAKAFTGLPLSFKIEGTTVFDSLSHEFQSRNLTLFSGEVLAKDSVTPPKLVLDETASQVFLLQADAPVIQVVLHVENPGSIGYFVYGKDISVLLNHEPLALQDIVPLPVAAGQTEEFKLLFYPDTKHLSNEALIALTAALEGTTTGVGLKGDLLLDVLGVDTFSVPSGWTIEGFLVGRN